MNINNLLKLMLCSARNILSRMQQIKTLMRQACQCTNFVNRNKHARPPRALREPRVPQKILKCNKNPDAIYACTRHMPETCVHTPAVHAGQTLFVPGESRCIVLCQLQRMASRRLAIRYPALRRTLLPLLRREIPHRISSMSTKVDIHVTILTVRSNPLA